jgi:hypothetical protein
VVAGCIGYLVGAMREQSVSHLPVDATVALEYLVSSESFSEIEQARAVLDALANRYVVQSRMLIVREALAGRGAYEKRQPLNSRPGLSAIQVLEEAVAEFDGTGQELQLLPTLLSALERERLRDRWIEVYLSALYHHPTHRVVGDMADEARRLGRAIGREAEVIAALRHVSAIPLKFASRLRIERCLASAGTDFYSTSLDHEQTIASLQF